MKYVELYNRHKDILNDEKYFQNVISSFYFSYGFKHIAYIKTTSSTYAAVSKQFADLVGLSPEHLLGKSDFEIQCGAKNLAKVFYDQDRLVENTRKKRKFLDINNYASGVGVYIFRKIPIINPSSNSVLGTHCVISLFKSNSPINTLLNFNNGRENILSKQDVQLYNTLTTREKEVLFCIVNGLTDRKLISSFLSTIHNKSIGADSTIRNILSSLYNKLPCVNTISSIHNYVIQRSCYRLIPNSILNASNQFVGISLPYE